MSRTSRNLVLAAAALMTLGTMSLASQEASARGFHGGGFHGGSHGGGVHRVGGIRHIGHSGPRWTHRHIHWHPRWRPRIIVAAPIIGATTYAAYSATPSWNRCTCLTKDYTPEGAVVFKDLCTKETAMNPPDTVNPAAYQQTTPVPQVQGSLQPQAPVVR